MHACSIAMQSVIACTSLHLCVEGVGLWAEGERYWTGSTHRFQYCIWGESSGTPTHPPTHTHTHTVLTARAHTHQEVSGCQHHQNLENGKHKLASEWHSSFLVFHQLYLPAVFPCSVCVCVHFMCAPCNIRVHCCKHCALCQLWPSLFDHPLCVYCMWPSLLVRPLCVYCMMWPSLLVRPSIMIACLLLSRAAVDWTHSTQCSRLYIQDPASVQSTFCGWWSTVQRSGQVWEPENWGTVSTLLSYWVWHTLHCVTEQVSACTVCVFINKCVHYKCVKGQNWFGLSPGSRQK